MCFVFISEETATCATYSINWLVFITEMVFTARYGLSPYITLIRLVFIGLRQTSLLKCDVDTSRRFGRTFCIHIQGGWPCSPLTKGRKVPLKRRQDIPYLYSGWKTVSTLKKREQGSSETTAQIYHTCCIASNNAKLQATSHIHKLNWARHVFLVRRENQNWATPSLTWNLPKPYALSVPPTQIFLRPRATLICLYHAISSAQWQIPYRVDLVICVFPPSIVTNICR